MIAPVSSPAMLLTYEVLSILFFLLVWFGYSFLVERRNARRKSLSVLMESQREAWIKRIAVRSNRIPDVQLHTSLISKAAFFASTSLFAVGGGLTMIGAYPQLNEQLSIISKVSSVSGVTLEIRLIGLVIIFIYCFFKFAWSVRLFNYASIAIGVIPGPNEPDMDGSEHYLSNAIALNKAAARQFNRGMRTIHFSLAYLGWLLGPLGLIVSTLLVLAFNLQRQYGMTAKIIAKNSTA